MSNLYVATVYCTDLYIAMAPKAKQVNKILTVATNSYHEKPSKIKKLIELHVTRGKEDEADL